VIEGVLAFLFKYPPRVFARGDLVFAPVFPAWLLTLVALGAVAAIAYRYSRLTTLAPRDRVVLGGLRAGVLLLVILALFRPTLVVSSAVPQRNVLAILLDDSRSMRLTDVGNGSRLDAVQGVFGDSTALSKALSEQYVLRYFRFSADARPVAGAGMLSGTGTRTDLAGALDAARGTGRHARRGDRRRVRRRRQRRHRHWRGITRVARATDSGVYRGRRTRALSP
jgi:hypothetical protein